MLAFSAINFLFTLLWLNPWFWQVYFHFHLVLYIFKTFETSSLIHELSVLFNFLMFRDFQLSFCYWFLVRSHCSQRTYSEWFKFFKLLILLENWARIVFFYIWGIWRAEYFMKRCTVLLLGHRWLSILEYLPLTHTLTECFIYIISSNPLNNPLWLLLL